MFDQMYELNTKYYKELTMYIIAGKKRLEYLRSNDLVQLREKAAQSGTQEDAQACNDFANLLDRFENPASIRHRNSFSAGVKLLRRCPRQSDKRNESFTI